jgi:hypothetical protein
MYNLDEKVVLFGIAATVREVYGKLLVGNEPEG